MFETCFHYVALCLMHINFTMFEIVEDRLIVLKGFFPIDRKLMDYVE